MNFLKKLFRSHTTWFVFILIVISFIYNYHKILLLKPRSIHQWRQTDCLSITLNYCKENLKFWEPEVHWRGCLGDGKMVGEFPIIYYTVAQLWKIFGQHEFIFRLITLLLLFSGLLALFKFAKLLLGDTYWSFIIPLFIFTSPVLVFYSNNFLPDTPAFALCLMGWYYFYKYSLFGEKKYFLFFITSFLFCGLLKASAFFSYFIILLILFLEFIGIVIIHQKISSRISVKKTLALVFPLVILFLWYSYAKTYNKNNTNSMFLMGVIPIWELDRTAISNILHWFIDGVLPQFMSPSFRTMILIMFMVLVLNFTITRRSLMLITIFLFIWCIMFFFLWFQAMSVHDYYLLNLLVLPVFVFLTFLDYLKRNFYNLFKSRWLKAVFLMMLCLNIYNCAEKVKIRYFNYGSLINGRLEVEFLGWFHWNYSAHFEALETITPYLRSLGIDRTDKVISLPDPSPNITLYLMDQKGWSNFDCTPDRDMLWVKTKIEQGAKYLIINDSLMLQQNFIKPFIGKQIGKYKNVGIYAL